MGRIFVAAIMALTGGWVHAADGRPDNELSFNLSLVSDYRSRGISQTHLKPGVFAGADYTNHPSGVYVGTWLATIEWVKDAGGKSEFEWDMYVGKRGKITQDISYDVGVRTYIYPDNGFRPSANTTEIYGQLGYGPVYAKYLNTVTNFFGTPDSRNSGYLDIGARFELMPDLALNLHAGRQTVNGPGHGKLGHRDWKIGLSKDFGFVIGSVDLIGTDTDSRIGVNKNLGQTTAVLSLKKIF